MSDYFRLEIGGSLAALHDIALSLSGAAAHDDGADFAHIASQDAQQIEHLRGEIARLERALEHERKLCAEMTAAAEKAQHDLSSAHRENQRLEARDKEGEKQLAKALLLEKDLSWVLAKANDEVKDLRKMVVDLNNEATAHKAEIARLTGDAAVVLDAKKATTARLRDEVARVTGAASESPPAQQDAAPAKPAPAVAQRIVDVIPPGQTCVVKDGVVQSRRGAIKVTLTKVVRCIGALSMRKERSLSDLAETYGFGSGARVAEQLKAVAGELAAIGLAVEIAGDVATMWEAA